MSIIAQILEKQQNGEWDAAHALCEWHLTTHPNDTHVAHLQALLLAQEGREAEAIAQFEMLLRDNPQEAVLHNHFANLLCKTGNLDIAKQHYEIALQINRDYLDARHNLILLLFKMAMEAWQQEDVDTAITHYEQLLVLDKTHLEAYNNLGAAYLKKENYLDAIRAFSTALRVDESHDISRHNLAQCLLLQKRYPQAIQQYRLLLEQYPHQLDWRYDLGFALMSQGELSEALEHFQTVLRAHPEHVQAHIHMGTTLHKLDRKNEALQHYQAALLLQPNDTSLKYLIASLTGKEAPLEAPAIYVKNLFNAYAEHFDRHLVDTLHYCVPQLLRASWNKTSDSSKKSLRILDLGCGTGLSGAAFRDIAKTLIGVDVSPNMIEKARAKNIYDELKIDGLLSALREIAPHSFDLILAADVWVYFGALDALIIACKHALRPSGYLLFSIEEGAHLEEYALQNSGRYTHSQDYLARLSVKNGFSILENSAQTTRHQNHTPVSGRIYLWHLSH